MIETPSSGTPTSRQAWYAVGVFTVALMFNFLDRGILNLLIPSIKADMHLSDTAISLIVGFAFVSFYAVVGFPIARLVDSKSRRLILGLGIATWSGMTAACGLAQNFWQLFMARLGVGVGEACNGPATFSMMSDMFPREKLAKAISVLNIGFAWGQGIALLVGGTVIGLLSRVQHLTLPLVGDVKPWQLAFLCVGLPGLLVAAALSTVVEPKRRGLMSGATPKLPPVRDVIRYMAKHRKAYGPMFLGLAVQAMMAFGIIAWMPTFFVRTHNWSIPQFGQALGTIYLIVYPFGLMFGGWLAERMARAGYDDVNMRIVVLVSILITPPLVAFPLVSNPWVAIVLIGLQNFILSWQIGPQNAALQVITPNEMRGQVTALYLFVFNTIGFGVGPTFIAVLTDYVFGQESMLRYSMVLAAVVMEPLSAWIFWKGLKHYREAYRATRDAAGA